MPYRSQAQRRFFHWAESHGKLPKGTAKKWEEHTNKKKLPEKIKKSDNPFSDIKQFLNEIKTNDQELELLLKEYIKEMGENMSDVIQKGGPGSGRHQELIGMADYEDQRLQKVANGANIHKISNLRHMLLAHKEMLEDDSFTSEEKEECANKLEEHLKRCSMIKSLEDVEKSSVTTVVNATNLGNMPIDLDTQMLASMNQDAQPYIIQIKNEMDGINKFEIREFDINSINGSYRISLSKSDDNAYKGTLRDSSGTIIMNIDNQTAEILGNAILTKIGSVAINNESEKADEYLTFDDLDMLEDDSDEVIVNIPSMESPAFNEVIEDIAENKVDEIMSRKPSISISVSPEGFINIDFKKSKENTMKFLKALIKAKNNEYKIEDEYKETQSQEDPNDPADNSMEPAKEEPELKYIKMTEHRGGKQFWYEDPATGRIYEKDNAPEGHADFSNESIIDGLLEKVSELNDRLAQLEGGVSEKDTESEESSEENPENKEEKPEDDNSTTQGEQNQAPEAKESVEPQLSPDQQQPKLPEEKSKEELVIEEKQSDVDKVEEKVENPKNVEEKPEVKKEDNKEESGTEPAKVEDNKEESGTEPAKEPENKMEDLGEDKQPIVEPPKEENKESEIKEPAKEEPKQNSSDDNAKLEIIKFFKEIGKPTDEQVHGLAEKLGLAPDKFEEIIYSLLADKLSMSKSEMVQFNDFSKPFKLINLKMADVPDENFNQEELADGIKVELEHVNDVNIAKMIAKAHLVEIPDYYTRLKKMEEEAKKELAPKAPEIKPADATIEKSMNEGQSVVNFGKGPKTSLKPPKGWWDAKVAEVKQGNPDYSDDQVSATVGSIWYKQMNKKERSQKRQAEGKKLGKVEKSKLIETISKKIPEGAEELVEKSFKYYYMDNEGKITFVTILNDEEEVEKSKEEIEKNIDGQVLTDVPDKTANESMISDVAKCDKLKNVSMPEKLEKDEEEDKKKKKIKKSRFERMWMVSNIEMPDKIESEEELKKANDGLKKLQQFIMKQGKEESEANRIVNRAAIEKYDLLGKGFNHFANYASFVGSKIDQTKVVKNAGEMKDLRKSDAENRFAIKEYEGNSDDITIQKDSGINNKVENMIKAGNVTWDEKEFKTFKEPINKSEPSEFEKSRKQFLDSRWNVKEFKEPGKTAKDLVVEKDTKVVDRIIEREKITKSNSTVKFDRFKEYKEEEVKNQKGPETDTEKLEKELEKKNWK